MSTGSNRFVIGPALQVLLVSIVAGITLLWQAYSLNSFMALWLTPDQQGRLAYEQLEFKRAYERFEDPYWKGFAAYSAGLYPEAAQVFGRINNAEGFFNRGTAFMKAREYRKAIGAFELAAMQAPDWAAAQDNLRLARHTLAYIERAREQSDTGDESEHSADDYVFDNTSERGLEVEITEQSTIELESAEKWMRAVDTETREFLRTRFLLEATQSAAP